MRREVLFLKDIIEATESIQMFLADIERDDFLENELIQSAVLQKLMIIGEAASHLSKEFRELHSEIEWTDIIGFRNIAIHAYFSVEWPIVWIAATKEAPELSVQIRQILCNEYPERGK
jgi:uncharacterized protein with HEPN domain